MDDDETAGHDGLDCFFAAELSFQSKHGWIEMWSLDLSAVWSAAKILPMSFPSTHWSMLAAQSAEGNGMARSSLEKVCRSYWQQVRAFVQAKGVPAADADDATQAFFAHALERMTFERADRARGRFRTFLLSALDRFLINYRRDAMTQKRGGGQMEVSLEDAAPEALMSDGADASRFDREWALALMAAATQRARDELTERGRPWQVFAPFMPGGSGEVSAAEAAERLGISEGAFRVELHRLRQAMKEAIRAEVARTVSSPDELEDELLYLRAVLSVSL